MLRPLLAVLAAVALSGCSCNQTDDPAPPEVEIDPGHLVLHRLNQAEYNNTVRDLFGTDATPADDFPFDDSSRGFDNIAATLSTSTLLVEMYERAAEQLAHDALSPLYVDTVNLRFETELAEASAAGRPGPDYFALRNKGAVSATFDVPETGTYYLSSLVWADQGGLSMVEAGLGHDGTDDAVFTVKTDDANNPVFIEVEINLTAGPHDVHVSFNDDYFDPATADERNLNVDYLHLEGPIDLESGPNPMRQALVACDPSRSCALEVMSEFLPRAWRRPVSAAELGGVMGIYDIVTNNGGGFDEGLQFALQSALMSPHFLYRVEVPSQPNSTEPEPLTDYEVATRLSYFLWSSMPDPALFDAAANGDLQTDAGLREQVVRMLADPKSIALNQNFGGQWLYIRAIANGDPDYDTYPDFDEELRTSMEGEMTRFFDSFLTDNRDLRELLTASEGEIDSRLGVHYGIAGVSDWTTVDLTPDDRGGLLGMAGLHMVNAYPARTSPVKRGAWVLSNLLCDEPPPPPAGVEGLPESDVDAATLRDILAQHREDPMCASCHDAMDPIGLGMEHFDAIGAYRTKDAGFPVDASGILPDGTEFYGTRELSKILSEDPRYARCLPEKLFTYGLGRSPQYEDLAALEEIEASYTANGWTFQELAIALALSPPFRMRRGESL